MTGARAWERALVPVRYALLRLRLRAPHTLLVGFGIAVGAAVLAMTAVGSAAVQDRAVQRALAQLQPSDRAIQAVWSGVPARAERGAAAGRDPTAPTAVGFFIDAPGKALTYNRGDDAKVNTGPTSTAH